MTFLSRALLALVLALALAFILVNLQDVELDLWAWTVIMPLWLLLIATLAVGVIIGGGVGWFGGAPRRRRSREQARKAHILEERVAALERERTSSPTPPGALPSPRVPPHMDEV